jgi:hypothetical protein
MTETVLATPTKEVVIGFDRPFVVIGDCTNPVPVRRSGIRRSRFPIAKTPEGAASRPAVRHD